MKVKIRLKFFNALPDSSCTHNIIPQSPNSTELIDLYAKIIYYMALINNKEVLSELEIISLCGR